ncbi:MAG: hypothetical protein AAF989_00330 [Planctomycetota bacterium]
MLVPPSTATDGFGLRRRRLRSATQRFDLLNDWQTMKNQDDAFLHRVRRSSATVFGQTNVGRRIAELCDDHALARREVLEDRTPGATVIAFVGATGQGKSWLVRQLIHDPLVASSIRSGNQLEDATESLCWIGPSPPVDLDARRESYVHCEGSKMQSIGIPYVLMDAPGATDDRQQVATVAGRALSIASVLVLVVRRDQLRSHAVSVLSEASEGTLVIPVVNAVRETDESLQADVDAFLSRLRRAAPRSLFSAPVLVADFEVSTSGPEEIGRKAAGELAARLQQALQDNWDGDRRQSTRLAAMEIRFRAALNSLLRDQLPGLSQAVASLNEETNRIPTEVAGALLGGGGSLQAAIRSRLRLGLMEETSTIWFPYRSVLGLLNLTNGAWDRLLLSLSGSLPSLIGTLWTGARNVAAGQDAGAEFRDGLLRRSSAAVDDRLRPLARHFRDELATLRQDRNGITTVEESDEDRANIAYLTGMDTLQEKSQELFESTCRVAVPSRLFCLVAALVSTAIFWTLMSGPVVALYKDYVEASFGVLGSGIGELDAFPRPDFSMILTSVVLSVFPMALFAMVVMTCVQRRGKVRRVESQLREEHQRVIGRLQQDGILRLRYDDPVLADAEFLLSIQANESDGESDTSQLTTDSPQEARS